MHLRKLQFLLGFTAELVPYSPTASHTLKARISQALINDHLLTSKLTRVQWLMHSSNAGVIHTRAAALKRHARYYKTLSNELTQNPTFNHTTHFNAPRHGSRTSSTDS